jgi:YVTN family beta-propeller protein
VEGAREQLGLYEAPRPSHRRWALLSAVAFTIAAVALGVLLTRGGGASAAGVTGRLIRIDPQRNEATKTAAVGRDPSGIAAGAGAVWMTSLPDHVLWGVDPKTLAAERISLGGTPLGVAVKEGPSFGQPTAGPVSRGLVFVSSEGAGASHAGGGVAMVEPQSGRLTGTIEIGDTTVIAGGRQGIWAVSGQDVERVVDRAFGIGKAVATVRLTPRPADEAHSPDDASGIAVGEGGVWVLGDLADRHLWRVDPVTRRVTAVITLPIAPGSVAAGLGGVWVTGQLDDEVLRIDPATNRVVTTIRVGRAPWGVAVGAGGVWVANTVDGTVSRIDPSTNRVVATITVGASPTAVAVGEGAVWVAAHAT